MIATISSNTCSPLRYFNAWTTERPAPCSSTAVFPRPKRGTNTSQCSHSRPPVISPKNGCPHVEQCGSCTKHSSLAQGGQRYRNSPSSTTPPQCTQPRGKITSSLSRQKRWRKVCIESPRCP